MEDALWHQSLTAEISEMLRFYRPAVFVFDGNVPYTGLVKALSEFPEMWKIWERRGMWRPGTGAKHLAQEAAFDAVVEPGELAGVMDRGLTANNRARSLAVPPIRFLRKDEALDRNAARAAIGLHRTKPAVLLQFGASNNFRTSDTLALVHAHLSRPGRAPRTQIVFGEWQISSTPISLPSDVVRLRTFPLAKFLAAFDYAIAMAGYNTFHENLAAGLPTLFLSNDNPEQDEQWRRGQYGALRGLCLTARSHDPYGISRALAVLGQESERAALRAACADLPQQNGADSVSDFLRHLAITRKNSQGAGILTH
jgi:UDP:flavonoid glycosyltransferase YjiC (YdhE family)